LTYRANSNPQVVDMTRSQLACWALGTDLPNSTVEDRKGGIKVTQAGPEDGAIAKDKVAVTQYQASLIITGRTHGAT